MRKGITFRDTRKHGQRRDVRPGRRRTSSANRPLRHPVEGRVGVALRVAGDGLEITGHADCINLHGLHAILDRQLPPEAPCVIRLELLDADTVLTGRGWVVYSGDSGTAIQFDELAPETAQMLSGYLSGVNSD